MNEIGLQWYKQKMTSCYLFFMMIMFLFLLLQVDLDTGLSLEQQCYAQVKIIVPKCRYNRIINLYCILQWFTVCWCIYAYPWLGAKLNSIRIPDWALSCHIVSGDTYKRSARRTKCVQRKEKTKIPRQMREVNGLYSYHCD